MRAAWIRQSKVLLYEGLDISGCVWACRVVGMSDCRLPILVGSWPRWEGRIDGTESILDDGVRHSGRLTIRRDDIDSLQRDNLRRRDGISSPIPVWRSQVLGCS